MGMQSGVEMDKEIDQQLDVLMLLSAYWTKWKAKGVEFHLLNLVVVALAYSRCRRETLRNSISCIKKIRILKTTNV
jgi:hypothetical protein